MKWALIIALMILMPFSALAQPTVGISFDEAAPSGTMATDVFPNVPFVAYIYAYNIDCYLTAFEYQLSTMAPLIVTSQTFPPEWSGVEMGDPFNGHSISYHPPMNGFVPGYNLLVTLEFFALSNEACAWELGSLVDVPLIIVGHPGTGIIAGTCYPDNYIFEFVGLTSILCPYDIATEEESWGAIKALYK